jgi:CRISPR/Cas system CMR-associated protein Cmr5 small subunit
MKTLATIMFLGSASSATFAQTAPSEVRFTPERTTISWLKSDGTKLDQAEYLAAQISAFQDSAKTLSETINSITTQIANVQQQLLSSYVNAQISFISAASEQSSASASQLQSLTPALTGLTYQGTLQAPGFSPSVNKVHSNDAEIDQYIYS